MPSPSPPTRRVAVRFHAVLKRAAHWALDDDDSHIEPLAMASSSGDGQHVELETLKKSSREMRDALQQMRLETLHNMVDELEVSFSGGSSTLQVLFLENKQAQMFTSGMIASLFDKMRIAQPPPAVINIRDSWTSPAMAGKIEILPTMTRAQGKWFEVMSYVSKDESEEMQRRVTAFVDEVLMPLVVKLEALVVCRGYSSCSMAAAVGDAFEQLRRQRGAPPNGRGPRLLVIAQAPEFIAPALKPGTNFNAVVAASSPALGTNHKSFFDDDFVRTALGGWGGDGYFRAKPHERSEERKRLGIDVLKLAREQASSTALDAPHSAPLAQLWRATCSLTGFITGTT